MRPWDSLPDAGKLSTIVPAAVLVHDDEVAFVVDLKRMLGKLEGRVYEVGGRGERVLSLTGQDEVGSLGGLLGLTPARVRLLPPILWQGRRRPASAPSLWAMVPRRLRPRRPRMEFLGSSRIVEEEVLEHALALERGVAWERGGSPRTAGNRVDDAHQRVASVRQAYGELRSDLVFRIEHPALFDPADPTTAAFERALAAFTAHDGAGPGEVEERAARVEVAFNVALRHARRRGLRHVPANHRGDVRRAAKAARLAAGATTDGERTASLRQVQRILDSLALYYLPSSTDTALQLEPPRP